MTIPTDPDPLIVEVRHADGSVSRSLDWIALLDATEQADEENEKAPGAEPEA